VAQFVVHHRHEPGDCGVVFAAFAGFASPLRHTAALASCPFGGHEIWWSVAAEDEVAALRQLPHFVAQRATARRVQEVRVP
jgi:hypothetical protein